LAEYKQAVFGKIRYLEGFQQSKNGSVLSLSSNECLLPACISNKYNIHSGDKITIQFAKGEVTYTVKAIYTEPYQSNIAFDTNLIVNELPEYATGKLDILLYAKEGISGKQIEDSYREKHDGQLNAFMTPIEDWIDNSLIVGRIIGALFFALGVIMLLVSGLMIHYMIKNILISDEKTIAIYKTIGYTSNDILSMYIKLYFIIITAACVAGIVSSAFLSNLILTSIFENMGQLNVNNPILPSILCYFVTVGFVITIITCNIVKTKNIKPVIALSGMIYGGIKKKKKYVGNSNFHFSSLGIAFRTFVRDKKNAIGIIITCIVTVFSVNFVIISLDVANTMYENNDFWLGVDKSDVMISIPDSREYDFVKSSVMEDDRIDYVIENSLMDRVTMKWKKGMGQTSMSTFMYDNYELADLPVVEGRNPNSGNEIAISTKMAEELNKNVGDYIELYLGGKKRADMLITGLFQSYMQLGSVCRLTTSAYTDNNCPITYNKISVYLKDSNETERFIKDMKDKIGGSGNVIKRTEQYSSIMDMVVLPQQKAIPPVVALVLLVAGINIYSIVMIKNLKTQKINGIYKCIGYTSWHLILSNLYYVGAIAVASVVITLPISMISYPTIMKLTLSMFNFMEYPVQYNFLHLAAINIVVILVFIISSLISSKSIFKVSTRDLVQE